MISLQEQILPSLLSKVFESGFSCAKHSYFPFLPFPFALESML